MHKTISVALGALALLTAAPATAATAATTDEGDTDQVCVVVVDTDEVSCGDSRAEAQAALDTRSATLTDILSVYDGRNFSGAEVLFQTTAGACSATYDREYEFPDLRRLETPDGDPLNINNWISSVRTYNRCDVKLYDPLGLDPPASTWIDESSNLSNVGSGWLNRASSLTIS